MEKYEMPDRPKDEMKIAHDTDEATHQVFDNNSQEVRDFKNSYPNFRNTMTNIFSDRNKK